MQFHLGVNFRARKIRALGLFAATFLIPGGFAFSGSEVDSHSTEKYRCAGWTAASTEWLSSGGQTERTLRAMSTGNLPLKVLIVRVDFTDLPGEPVSSEAAIQVFEGPRGVKQYFATASYGKVSFTVEQTNVTPVLRLPKHSSEYDDDYFLATVVGDALQASANAGYNTNDYDRTVIACQRLGVPWAGVAHGNVVVINGAYDFGTIAHELGHTFGMPHASSWVGKNGDSVADSNMLQYGDSFDLMGSGGTFDCDLNPYFKNMAGWIPDQSVSWITNSGIYRVYRFDHANAELSNPDKPLALRLRRNFTRDYWISFRQAPIEGRDVNGAYVVFGFNPMIWGDTAMIDFNLDPTTPPSYTEDGILKIGQAFEDRQTGIRFRVLGQSGASPSECLELEITIPEQVDLPSALDLEQGIVVPPALRSWYGVKGDFEGGSDAARSSPFLEHDRSSTLKVGIEGPGGMSFWWRTSSEPDEDWLILLLDGVELTRISGETPWQQRGLEIPPGLHTIEWRYSKSLNTTIGADCGWVDRVEFSALPLNLPQTITFGSTGNGGIRNVPFELKTSASSGLPVSCSIVEGPALLSGNIVTPTGSGLVRVRATQPGSSVYNSAAAVEQVFTVEPSTTTLGADTPEMKVLVGGRDWRKVHAMARQSDGKLIIGGYFSHVNGVPRSNIARFNADGTLDQEWAPVINRRGVLSMAIAGEYLFVVGDFDSVDGAVREGKAKISLSGRGELVREWNPPILHNNNRMVLAYGDDVILAGGFQTAGSSARANLAKFSQSGTGALNTTWSPSVNGDVERIALSGTNLYISGLFDYVNGEPRQYLAKISAEGSGAVDLNWKSDPFKGPFIHEMVATPQALYVGGSWIFGQAPSNYFGLAKFSAATGRILNLGGWDRSVKAMGHNGTNLFVGWGYDSTDPNASHFLAKLSLEDLSVDADWKPHVISSDLSLSYALGEILSIVVAGNDVFAGGDFVSVGGGPSSGVALVPRLDGEPTTPDTTMWKDQMSEPIRILPHSTDALETTHYQVSEIENGELFKADGSSRIFESDFISASEALAGVRFRANPGFFGIGGFKVQASLRSATIGLGGQKAMALVQVLAEPIMQEITFAPLPDQNYGVGPIALSAGSSLGLPVSFRVVAGPASIENNAVVIAGTGLVEIEAYQEGTEFVAAASVIRQFRVNKAEQQIDVEMPATARFSDRSVQLSAAASSGLPLEFNVRGPARVEGNQLLFDGVGNVLVRIAQAGNDLYAPAFVERSITVLKGLQTIDFPQPGPARLDEGPLQLNAMASSGLPVQYLVLAGAGTVETNRLFASAAGDIILAAAQGGDANYEAAVNVERTVTIQPSFQELKLDISTEGSALLIRWPGGFEPLVIQESPNGLGNWTVIEAATDTNNNVVTARIPVGEASSKFYRLQVEQ